MSPNAFDWSQLTSVSRQELYLNRQIRAWLNQDKVDAALMSWQSQLWPDDTSTACAVQLIGVTQMPVQTGADAPLCFALHDVTANLSYLFIHSTLSQLLLSALYRLPRRQSLLRSVSATGDASHAGAVAYIIATLFSQAHDLWSVRLGLPVQPTQPSALPAGDMWLEFAATLPHGRGSFWVSLSQHHQSALTLVRRPTQLQWKKLAQLHLCLPVVIARIVLSLADVRLLSENDVVVPDTINRSTGTLRVGCTAFDVHCTDDDVQLTAVHQHQEEELPMTILTEEQRAIAAQLQVPLTVEIGRVKITAADAVALQVGDMVTLDRPPRSAVDVRIGEKLFARGELIDVDGELGIRLVEIVSRAE